MTQKLKTDFFERYKWALDELIERFGNASVRVCRYISSEQFAIAVLYEGKSNVLILHKTDTADRVVKSFDKTEKNITQLKKFIEGFREWQQ